MSKYYDRPKGALYVEDLESVPLGTDIYCVIGTWPPFVYYEGRLNDRGDDEFFTTEKEYVYDDPDRYEDTYINQLSFHDRNMVSEISYNNNFIFVSQEEAQAAADLIKKAYLSNEEMMKEEKDRVEEFIELECMYDDCWYESDYDDVYDR